jgi:hypothetical protein
MALNEFVECPICLRAFNPEAARPCEHPEPTLVCPHCRQCSCAATRRIPPPEPHDAEDPTVGAFLRREPVLDPNLYNAYRDAFDAHNAVPVGLSGNTLFAYTTRRDPHVRHELHAALLEAGLPIARIILAAVDRLPESPQPPEPVLAAWPDGAATTYDGRQTRTARNPSATPGAVTADGITLFVPHITPADLPPLPPAAAVRMLHPTVDLPALRAWLGKTAATCHTRDPFLAAAASACGFLPARTPGVTLLAPYTLRPSVRRRLWLLQGPHPARPEPFRIEASEPEPCACGACPGWRLTVRIIPEP